MMMYQFIHNKVAQRFELVLDQENTAFISYQIKESKLYLDHTYVPDAFSGKGIAKLLAEKTFAFIQDEGFKAVAICSYLVALVQKSPQWNFIEI